MLHLLEDEPSLETIEQCIAGIDPTSQVEFLRLIAMLLKHTVPEVYIDAPCSTQNAIALVFRSTVGLGNLLGRISLSLNLNQPISHLERLLIAYCLLLDQVLKPGLVHDALLLDPSKNNIYLRELDKLLFRGKTYSIACEIALKHPNIGIPSVVQNVDAYSRYLSKELLSVNDPTPFISSLFSIGTKLLNQFFAVMLCPENLHHLTSLRTSLKRYERKSLIGKFLDFSVGMLCKANDLESKIKAMSVIANEFLDGSVWDELTLEDTLSKCNYSINLLSALLVQDPKNMTTVLLRSWGNKTLMQKEPITKQEYRTHCLACLISQLPVEHLTNIMRDSDFLNAISNRLMSQSNKVKALGILLADELAKTIGQQSIFSIDVLEEVSVPLNRIPRFDAQMSLSDAWSIYNEPTVSEVDDELLIEQIQKRLEPLKLVNQNSNENSDEEDDITISTSKRVPKPLYIRDLLAYLSVDEKEAQAYEKRKIALKTAPFLLKNKLGFGSEVIFYAEDLLSKLAALTNFFEEDDFEAQKLNAMIATAVASPKVTSHICHLLLTGDYSLQQRISLLTTMVLSARELRGFTRDGDESQHLKTLFPTRMLPEKLHALYINMDDECSRIQYSIQDLIMSEPSDEAKDQLAGGKILRISSKLKKKTQQQDVLVSKDQLRNFGSIVGKQFFFPLLAIWYESGGINIGHYTPLFVGHYIRSLSLILHSAYPIAPDVTDMSREFLNVVVPILQSLLADQLQILESSVTGLMVILDITDDLFIVTEFGQMMSTALNAVQRLYNSIIDNRVKSLCAGLLYKYANLQSALDRTLMDQMNGSFYG